MYPYAADNPLLSSAFQYHINLNPQFSISCHFLSRSMAVTSSYSIRNSTYHPNKFTISLLHDQITKSHFSISLLHQHLGIFVCSHHLLIQYHSISCSQAHQIAIRTVPHSAITTCRNAIINS